MGNMQEGLAKIRSQIHKTSPGEGEPVIPCLEDGTAEIKTSSGAVKVILTEEDQREMIENQKKLQKAVILEKKLGIIVNVGLATLAIVTAVGSGIALYKGSTGKSNSTL